MIQIDEKFLSKAHFEAEMARVTDIARLAEHPHDRYAVCFAETADWLSLFFAIRSVGASVLPIHPGTPYAAARRLADKAGCNRLFYNSLEAELLPHAAPEKRGELLQMSSGTTGDPKCIARSWSDIDSEVDGYVGSFHAPQDMTPVIACPTTHSYGLICGILVALKRGKTPVILDTGNPKYLLRKLREFDRPLLLSSPALLHTLARLLPQDEKIHATMTSGTLLPEPWFAKIRSKSTHMYQQYGCSEAGCIAINPDVSGANEIGHVLPHLKLDNPGNVNAPAEIVVAARQGTIHTRDLGYCRADGMLVFISRLDDMINVSGMNVYPKDVEAAVMAMPVVTDAVAFRKSDPFAGERVALLFSASAPVSKQEMRDWCGGNLASHQIPMEVIQVDTVARQANGKISRREIAAQYESGAFHPASREAAQ